MFRKIAHVLFKFIHGHPFMDFDDSMHLLLEDVDPTLGVELCKLILQFGSPNGISKIGRRTSQVRKPIFLTCRQ